MKEHKLYLPWRVVRNLYGRIAIVDARNVDPNTGTGRVCTVAQGKNDRGSAIAHVICRAVNKLERP